MQQHERDLLVQELSLKRRLHQVVALKAARFGINAPTEVTIEKEDLEREIRTIERALNQPITPTLQERVTPPRVQPQRQRYSQEDIAHQWGLLQINRRNFQYLTRSVQNFGNFDSAPLHIQNQWVDTREEIVKRKAILRSMGQTVDNMQGED